MFGIIYPMKRNKYEQEIFNRFRKDFFVLQTYVKQFQDQKANYEEEKKRLSPNDLQTVDADQRAKRIENRLKKVFLYL